MVAKQFRLIGAYEPIRVLVADDSVSDRRLIQELLAGLNDVEVIGTARDGYEALEKAGELAPDIVLVDNRMPRLSGAEIFRRLRDSESNAQVILLSNPVAQEAESTIDALWDGVFDFVVKPTFGGNPQRDIARLQRALATRIDAYRSAFDADTECQQVRGASRSPNRLLASLETCNAAVALGASTGGPGALRLLLSALPEDLPVPVLIAHPMPAPFTRALAERLDQVSELTVREAKNGDLVKPGTALLAPGGRHMEVVEYGGQPRIRLSDSLPLQGCRPAVDRLFTSVAEFFGANAIGVILSGNGSDGTKGSQAIVEAGGRVLAQDAAAVVNEMPESVIRAGFAYKVVPIEMLGLEIRSQVGERTAQLV
jgi:two-component system chemotaxis response regulator CheB